MAGRNLFANAQQNFNKVHHRLGSSPLINWFLGAFSLLLWICGTIIQIQTSEYLAMGTNIRVAGVAWGVLAQPWLMITGQAPVAYATAWIYAWVVELVTLVFAMSLSVAITKIGSVNARLATLFVIASIVLIGLNGYADYASSPGANGLVQFLVALAIGIIVVCGLPLGIGLIEHGFSEL